MSMRMCALVSLCAVCFSCEADSVAPGGLESEVIVPPGTPLRSVLQYRSFAESPSLALVGSTAVVGGDLRLTESEFIVGGAAWFPQRVGVAAGFVSRFQYRLSDLDAVEGLPVGADGLVFVVQNSLLSQPLGLPGCGMGYAGIPNSIGVAFDTFANGPGCGGDPDDNHVSVLTGGSIEEDAGLHTEPITDFDLNDGELHDAAVTYFNGTLSVYLEDLDVPRFSVPVDLAQAIGSIDGKAWVGFTAATAFSFQRHEVATWALNSVPVEGCGTPVAVEPGERQTVAFEMRASTGAFTLHWAQLGGARYRVLQGGQVLHDTGCTRVTVGTVPVLLTGSSTQVLVDAVRCGGGVQGPAEVIAECMPTTSATPRFGADTSSSPAELGNVPALPPTEFYIGRLGHADYATCSVVRETNLDCRDIITDQPCDMKCLYDGAVAEQVGRTNAHGYWLLRGPDDVVAVPPGAAPTDAQRAAARRRGREQADALVAQAIRYHTVVGGRALFADIEDEENNAGWFLCSETIPNTASCPPAAELNEITLTEFLERLVEQGYTPGIYSNKTSMTRFFPTDYIPRYQRGAAAGRQIPVALWITSCGAHCGRDAPTAATVQSELPGALDAIFAGARALIWQYYIPGSSCGAHYSVDLNATLRDPTTGLVPDIPVILPPNLAQKCSRDP